MKTNKNHTQTTTKRSTNAATVNNTTQAPANEPAATTAAQEQTAETPDDYPATLIDITRLRTSPYNPRRSYDQQGIRELADTMREVGLLHPIHARIKDGHYEIITGERRYHAAKLLGWKTITVCIRNVTDDIARDMALTENLQREDMPPMDEAKAYKEQVDNGNDMYTLAAKYGKSERYIYDRLRLNDLIPQVAELLDRRMITLGIAIELSKCEKHIQQDLYDNHLQGQENDDTPQTGWRGKGLADFRRLLRDAYTTDLARYNFDKTECRSCPHNTNTYDMFAEHASGGHCTNTECLTAKNNAYILAKSHALLKVSPHIAVAQCEPYRGNPAIVEKLEEEGHAVKNIGYSYRTLPPEPVIPAEETFDSPEQYEQAQEEYTVQKQQYENALEEAIQSAEKGDIRLMIHTDNHDAQIVAVPVNRRPVEPDFVKRLTQQKNDNVQRAFAKVIEETRELVRDNIEESKPFTAFEENVIYYLMLKYVKPKNFKRFGEQFEDKHYLETQNKIDIVKELTDEMKEFIKRDFITYHLTDSNSAIDKQLLLEYANIHYPQQIGIIKARQEEVCENKNIRLDERIAEYQAKEKVKKEHDKKRTTEQEPAPANVIFARVPTTTA